MTSRELDHLLHQAATALPGGEPAALEPGVMARVRVDEGRARRWRVFLSWLLGLAVVAGIGTAVVIGYARARQDTTHDAPPVMPLFREALTR
jgi:hypothetical protein